MKEILALLLSMWTLAAFVDGIPFEGNRVKGEKTTVLTLTSKQVEILELQSKDTNNPSIVTIALTKEQEKVLLKEAGSAPSKLEVWSVDAAKGTCTCELENMGIRFEKTKIEVPHYLLCRSIAELYDTPETSETNTLRISPKAKDK